MHPIISDGNRSILYGADIIPMAAHIPIPWVVAYDIQPLLTVQEKGKLHHNMEEENGILFFDNDTKLQACTVRQEGKHVK